MHSLALSPSIRRVRYAKIICYPQPVFSHAALCFAWWAHTDLESRQSSRPVWASLRWCLSSTRGSGCSESRNKDGVRSWLAASSTHLFQMETCQVKRKICASRVSPWQSWNSRGWFSRLPDAPGWGWPRLCLTPAGGPAVRRHDPDPAAAPLPCGCRWRLHCRLWRINETEVSWASLVCEASVQTMGTSKELLFPWSDVCPP